MGFYSEIIRKREENNIRLEKYADESLILNDRMQRIEGEVEDAQTAVIYLLKRFGLTVPRVPGHYTIDAMLETILDPLGMMYEEGVSVKEASRKKEHVLAFRDDGKAVVLMPTIRGYRYFCPSDSSQGYASPLYLTGLRDECYVFSRPLEMRSTLPRTFLYNVLKSMTVNDVMQLVIATGLVTGLGYILPLINKWIYNVYVTGAGSSAGFIFTLTVFLTVGLIRSGLTLIKSLTLSSMKVRISTRMQMAIMARILHLPQEFFQSTSSGRVSKRISNCGRLSDMILQIIMDVLLDLTFSLVYLYQMRGFAPQLFLPAVLFLVVKIIISILGAVSYAYNEAGILKIEMENNGFLFSVIRGVQKVKGMGAEKAIYSRWADMYRRTLALTYQQPFFLKYNSELLSMVSTATTIALLSTSIFYGIDSQEYLTFTSSYALVVTVVTSLTDIMQNVFLVRTLTDNVRPIFEWDSEEQESLEYVRRLRGDIRADNIVFTYPDDTRGCLRGVSLDIKSGERVAIVGASGCGKSTLLKILMGLEKPEEGVVYYDGKPLNTLNMRSLRRRIGSVFQFSRVFPGTIADNVTFGSVEPANDEKIWEALDKAAIGDYIRGLPLQLDTEISESVSSGFSGGQRQRILLARALLDNPGILILDEATSALDNVTQAKVLESIRQQRATVVMVAHRLSTVENFDRIIMLENGAIAEEGTYNELMERNGKFAELVRKQMIRSHSS